jgi:hypothetical protein
MILTSDFILPSTHFYPFTELLMSNLMRWRYGETNPVQMAVDSATVIEIGDLVWLDSDDAKNAAALAWDTDLETTQEEFHDNFLGVAMQASPAGETDSIRVATSGVFELDTAAASYEVGDLVGPDDDATPLLVDQQVIAVAGAELAVGRVAKTAASATSVLVSITSTVLHGGPQTAA